MNTLGDRIATLLRDRGRQDRNAEYTQAELSAMLSSEMQAPNGKYYRLYVDRSTISKIISGKRKPQLDVLLAICEIFDTPADWILRGITIEPQVTEFETKEANMVAMLMDTMDEDARKFVLEIARYINAFNQERKTRQIELAHLMKDVLYLLPQAEQIKVKSVMNRMMNINATLNRSN